MIPAPSLKNTQLSSSWMSALRAPKVSEYVQVASFSATTDTTPSLDGVKAAINDGARSATPIDRTSKNKIPMPRGSMRATSITGANATSVPLETFSTAPVGQEELSNAPSIFSFKPTQSFLNPINALKDSKAVNGTHKKNTQDIEPRNPAEGTLVTDNSPQAIQAATDLINKTQQSTSVEPPAMDSNMGSDPIELQGTTKESTSKNAPRQSVRAKQLNDLKDRNSPKPVPPKSFEQKRLEKFIFDKIHTVPDDLPFEKMKQFAGALHRVSHQENLTQLDLTMLGSHEASQRFAVGHGVEKSQLEAAKMDPHSLQRHESRAQLALIETGYAPEQHHTGAYHNPHVNSVMKNLDARRKEQQLEVATSADQALQRAPRKESFAL